MSDRFARIAPIWGVILCLTLAWSGQLLAQTNVASAAAPENRYLLIVETSRSMEPRGDGLLGAVQDLLVSGMGGQLRRGDSLGVWTFNEDLYTRRLPLQRWSEEGRKRVVKTTLTFLQDQKYEKAARLDKVLPAMAQLTQKSEFLTVILVSTGEGNIRGTPFDKQINDAYKRWRAQQQKAKMPLVTVLRAAKGRITDYSVNPAPWKVEMPPLPAESRVAPTVAKEPASPASKTPPPMGQPLIVHGKKPEVAKAEATAAVPDASRTNVAADAAEKPTTAETPAPVSTPEPPPAAPSNSSAALVVPTEAPATSSAPAEAVAPPSGTNAGAARALAQEAAAAPQGSRLGRASVWVAGSILVAAVLAVAIVLVRRMGAAPGASLITRSLDREDTP